MNARCPECRSDDIYWSRSGNDGVPLLMQLFVVAGRCHDCGQVSLLRGPLLFGPTLEPPPATKGGKADSQPVVTSDGSALDGVGNVEVVATMSSPAEDTSLASASPQHLEGNGTTATLEITRTLPVVEPVIERDLRKKSTARLRKTYLAAVVVVATFSILAVWWIAGLFRGDSESDLRANDHPPVAESSAPMSVPARKRKHLFRRRPRERPPSPTKPRSQRSRLCRPSRFGPTRRQNRPSHRNPSCPPSNPHPPSLRTRPHRSTQRRLQLPHRHRSRSSVILQRSDRPQQQRRPLLRSVSRPLNRLSGCGATTRGLAKSARGL